MAEITKEKDHSIENMRIFLTVLVVLHHLACTYGGPRIWYYQEPSTNFPLFALLTVFIAVNQSFFMGLFFLISAYFAPRSLHEKGSLKYMRDRLFRLGIPLSLYYFVLSPITVYMATDHLRNGSISLWQFLLSFRGHSFGPLWFIEALLLFSLLYALVNFLFRVFFGASGTQVGIPKDSTVIAFTVITGVLTFSIRIWFPVGRILDPFSIQPAHFVQYIILFGVGVVAYRNHWLSSISLERGLRWFMIAQLMIFVVTPIILFWGGGFSGALRPFYGGWHWQSFVYSVWEQIVGFSLILGLLGLFKNKYKFQSTWASSLSSSTYAVFVIHAPILVSLCVFIKFVRLDPFFKFIILAPISVILSFSLALLIRTIPFVKKVM